MISKKTKYALKAVMFLAKKYSTKEPVLIAEIAEAEAIHREDVAACRRMGALGAARIPDGSTILTHCNAGALATGGYGTALGVVRAAYARSRDVRVLAAYLRLQRFAQPSTGPLVPPLTPAQRAALAAHQASARAARR